MCRLQCATHLLRRYRAIGTVFAEGHVYRRAVGEPKNILVVIGVWLLFGMTAATALMPFLDGNEVGFPGLLMAAVFVPISVVVIGKSTSRYLSRKLS